MFHWQLNKDNLVLSGTLDKYSGVELWNNRHRFLKTSTKTMQISLSQLERTDSAGLASLVALCKEAKRKNINLSIHQAPKQLLDIAKISGIDTILPLTG